MDSNSNMSKKKKKKKEKKENKKRVKERERETKYVANLTCYKLSFYKHLTYASNGCIHKSKGEWSCIKRIKE